MSELHKNEHKTRTEKLKNWFTENEKNIVFPLFIVLISAAIISGLLFDFRLNGDDLTILDRIGSFVAGTAGLLALIYFIRTYDVQKKEMEEVNKQMAKQNKNQQVFGIIELIRSIDFTVSEKKILEKIECDVDAFIKHSAYPVSADSFLGQRFANFGNFRYEKHLNIINYRMSEKDIFSRKNFHTAIAIIDSVRKLKLYDFPLII